jgi:hypothetical protein
MSSYDVSPDGEKQIIELSRILPAILYSQTFHDENTWQQSWWKAVIYGVRGLETNL